jgi:hypothetical protein
LLRIRRIVAHRGPVCLGAREGEDEHPAPDRVLATETGLPGVRSGGG